MSTDVTGVGRPEHEDVVLVRPDDHLVDADAGAFDQWSVDGVIDPERPAPCSPTARRSRAASAGRIWARSRSGRSGGRGRHSIARARWMRVGRGIRTGSRRSAFAEDLRMPIGRHDVQCVPVGLSESEVGVHARGRRVETVDRRQRLGSASAEAHHVGSAARARAPPAYGCRRPPAPARRWCRAPSVIPRQLLEGAVDADTRPGRGRPRGDVGTRPVRRRPCVSGSYGIRRSTVGRRLVERAPAGDRSARGR